MYEPPIKLFETPWRTIVEEKEDAIYAKIQSEYGVDLDKKELIRALQYDRNQYEKGYADGEADAMASIVRCKDCKNGELCSIREAMACTTENGYCWRGERRTE